MTPEDEKLVALARAARARIQAAQGAAVRDDTGRSYAGASVALPSLQVSALDLAVAQAVAAGATGLEAAVVVGGDAPGLDGVRDLGGTAVPVWHCAATGAVVEELST
ncbi:MAG: cytidine deaminase [Micrococcales bacterium]|nr:cytidine deaminase [Micrococcales bacterium]